MDFKTHFLKRRYLIIAGILVGIFVILTKVIAILLIHYNVIYDTEVIWVKAGKLAAVLTWPLSDLLSTTFVNSYYFIPFVFLYYLILVILLHRVHLFLKSRKLYLWVGAIVVAIFLFLRLYPNSLCALDNDKHSQSMGSTGNGRLKNGKRLVFKGNNFQYFNFLSYLKGNCFVHEKIKQSLLDAYKTCETTCPGITFYTGEGSLKRGGPFIFNHRTHQNGLSLDLLLTYKKDSAFYNPISLFNAYGYGLDTDEQGMVNQSKPINWYPEGLELDFETNARLLLALDDACKKNGAHIRIVILKTSLLPHLLATPSGKKLVSRNLRFAHTLTPMLNQAHDDHFHVDFEILKEK